MQPLQIVVIEDYDALRQAICDVLVKDGHSVFSAAMAEDLDDETCGFIGDLYIIDLNLPGEDGFSLSRRIRQSQPDVGIVIVSARTSVEDRIGGYQSGGNIYLTKPLSLEELRAVVASFQERKSNREFSSPNVLRLNTLNMILTGPLGRVALTERETGLVSAFSKASKNELEHWQVASHLKKGEDITKENLEVKVGRLRRKLIICGANHPAIQSIRGVGYRILNRVIVEAEL